MLKREHVINTNKESRNHSFFFCNPKIYAIRKNFVMNTLFLNNLCFMPKSHQRATLFKQYFNWQ